MIDKFNIRVYGIWLKDNKILISHENIDGFQMLKLPGGGLEFGETPADCVKREFFEELGVTINARRLLHVTEQFIQSVFKKNEQVIAVHYEVESIDQPQKLEIIQPTNSGRKNAIKFEWRTLNQRLLEDFTFEMDKEAIQKLLNR